VSWEWIVLAVYTVLGPVLFHRFLPTRKVVTVRGGAVFDVSFGPIGQVLRSVSKFAFVWLIAFLLVAAEHRAWFRVWVFFPVVVGMTGHFVFTRKYRVHWLWGSPLETRD